MTVHPTSIFAGLNSGIETDMMTKLARGARTCLVKASDANIEPLNARCSHGDVWVAVLED